MVTCVYLGRLGNQMFQIAATIAHAKRNNDVYLLPTEVDGPKGTPIYFPHLPQYNGHPDIEYCYTERGHPYQQIPYRPNMCLRGYWQTEKYFAEYRKEILEAFRIPYEMRKGVVSIHCRRGDYVDYADKFPPTTIDFVEKAVSHFVHLGYSMFMLFSDDIEWCKANIKPKLGEKYFYGPCENEMTDLRMMSGCEHNIIANSSFSWWAAWLNQNPNKIVIAPKVWFGAASGLDYRDQVPQKWITM